MRLTVRLKNEDDSFEPAVNIIPVPDAPGPKLDYDYQPVSDDKWIEMNHFIENSLMVVRILLFQCPMQLLNLVI